MWTSPSDNTTAANFLIYGNAVNGNNAPTVTLGPP